MLQSQAALTNAQVTLDDTVIRAPSNGTIVRKGANVGDALSPGQTIATMTKGDYVWIQANFKETQLQYVRVGQPVTCTVDAYPGKTFYGKVQSVNEASGNTTSLLPADNATGNFTKVVQRIPVKIILYAPKNPGLHDANNDDIRNLRQGMSVETDIDVSTARQNGGRGNQNDQNGDIGNVSKQNNNSRQFVSLFSPPLKRRGGEVRRNTARQSPYWTYQASPFLKRRKYKISPWFQPLEQMAVNFFFPSGKVA